MPSLLNTRDGLPTDQQAAPARGGRRREVRQLRRADGARPALLPRLRHQARSAAGPARDDAGRGRPGRAGDPGRAGEPPGRRLAAGGGDRDRPARRDAADRRPHRPRRHERRFAPGGDDPGRRGHRQHDHRVETDSGGGSDTPIGSVSSEWPPGTDGFTIQINALTKSTATPESVDSAKQSALDDGAPARRGPRLRPVLQPAAGRVRDLLRRLRLPQGGRRPRSRTSATSFPDATVLEVSGAPAGRDRGGRGHSGGPQADRPAGLEHPGPQRAARRPERGRDGVRG